MRREVTNDTAAELGFSMVSCGFEHFSEGSFTPLCTKDHYIISCVTKGVGAVTVNGRTFLAKKGEVFITRPHVPFSYSSLDRRDAWSLAWFGFKGRDCEFYLEDADIQGDTVAKKANENVFLAAVKNCIDYFDSCSGAPSQAKATAFLLEALHSAKNTRRNTSRLEPSSQVDRAIEFIEYNYMRGITAGDVALQLSIDRTYFFRIFKARTGVSPERYIMKYRIEKAEKLLREDKHTVTEIASLVGVSDVYYFSKLFKKNVGQSPTEYKKAFLSAKERESVTI